MNVFSNIFPERLYLSKGENTDIYVNNCRILRKSQIDGLRRLYKLFIKKSLGAILNNPSNSGKTVLVTLFIESIHKLLNNPVLILCNDDHEIQYWKEMLLKWTKYTEDNIAIESSNPYLKKNIFIQKFTDLSVSFIRRSWSVLVLKNDEITKEIGKMVFDTEFKIWITTVDVFRDLKMLSSVSKWINPHLNINIEDFEIKNKNLHEKIKTVILMEAFTEDFVVRTDDVKSILQKTNELNKSTTATISKKNKDATGTKIKTSKRKHTDNIYNEPSSIKSNKNKKFSIDRTMVQSKHSKNNEEAYINDVEDKDSPSILNMNNSFSKNNKSNNQITAQKSINENNANTQHTHYNENNLKADESKEFESKCKNIDIADLSAHSQLLLTEDSNQSLTDASQKGVNKEIDTETSTIELDAIEDVKNEICNITNIKEIERELQIDVNEIEKIKKCIENKDGTIAEQCAHSQGLLTEDSTQSLTEISENSVNKKLNEESSEIKLDAIKDVEIKINHDMNTKSITNIKENEINKSQRDANELENAKTGMNRTINEKKKVDQKTEKIVDSFDQKISELEARTLKKFKGSILDSIF